MNNTPFTQSISLKDMGIENAKIHYQLSANELQDMTVASGQGIEISTGALAINRRIYRKISSRSIYRKEQPYREEVWWGKVNIPFEPKAFDAIKKSHCLFIE
jgi:phosphoenolpyruvate carboxykinase (ATP)